MLWLLGTAAVITKHNSAFIVFPLFVWCWGYRRGVIAMLLSVLVFLVSFLPYVPEGSVGILHNVFLYHGNPERYGLLALPIPDAVRWLIMGVGVFAAPALVRKLPLAEALLICVLMWLTLTAGISVQYFLLPLMLGALEARRHRGWLLALGLAVSVIEVSMMLPYQPENPIVRLAWSILWLICATWLFVLTVARLPQTHRVVMQVRRNFFDR